MKNIALLMAAVMLVAVSSCKKTYECSCTTVVKGGTGNQSFEESVTLSEAVEGNQKKAERLCQSHERFMQGNYGRTDKYTKAGIDATSSTTCVMTKL